MGSHNEAPLPRGGVQKGYLFSAFLYKISGSPKCHSAIQSRECHPQTSRGAFPVNLWAPSTQLRTRHAADTASCLCTVWLALTALHMHPPAFLLLCILVFTLPSPTM